MLEELHSCAEKPQKLVMYLHFVCQINFPRSYRHMKQGVYFMADNVAGASYHL